MIAGVGATLAAAFAGCLGDDDEDGTDGTDGTDGEDGNGGDGDPEDAAVDWVSEAANFEGSGDIEDHTGEDGVTIENGVQVDGQYTFNPPAVRVDPGTEITWEWASDGHNIEPQGDGQGASITDWDGESSIEDEGHTNSETFDDEGVALWECGPHRAQGQRGAVIVE